MFGFDLQLVTCNFGSRVRGVYKLVHLCDQLLYRLKRLSKISVGSDPGRFGFVERFERSDQKDDRNVPGRLIGATVLADLVSVWAGHVDVGENNVGKFGR